MLRREIFLLGRSRVNGGEKRKETELARVSTFLSAKDLNEDTERRRKEGEGMFDSLLLLRSSQSTHRSASTFVRSAENRFNGFQSWEEAPPKGLNSSVLGDERFLHWRFRLFGFPVLAHVSEWDSFLFLN